MALTEMVMMPGVDYQNICDAIRAKNGQTDLIKSGEAADLILNLPTGGDGPEIFSVYKTGEYTPTADASGLTTKITHDLGVEPDFYCIYAKPGQTVGTGYLVSALGIKTGTTGQVMYIHGTTAAKGLYSTSYLTSTQFSMGASSGKYKAGVTYVWIVGVTK